MKRYVIVVVLVLLIILTGCAAQSDVTLSNGVISPKGVPSGARVSYYFDEVHQVGIWLFACNDSSNIAVLPANQFTNPEKPMR